MKYRLLVDGDVIKRWDEFIDIGGEWTLAGDFGFPIPHCGLTYRRPIKRESSKCTERLLLESVKELISLMGTLKYPKWSQWEEVVTAKELLSLMSNPVWRELTPDETIENGDEFSLGTETNWRYSHSAGRTVWSQGMSREIKYRRKIKDKPASLKLLKSHFSELIECVEGLLYLGKDEKYSEWEEMEQVINARRLIASIKEKQ